ncbi:MAG TPA: molybdopterin cofactor-binding domain-containing protein, partial [Blastocatellia bacterium]|nr:molybdopterin cofactor-binding domain-containing protein [Blastocatellia bacterium]
MTTFTSIPKQIKEVMEKWNGTTSRRDFLKDSGLFVVSFSAVAIADASMLSTAPGSQTGAAAQAAGPYPDPDFRKLDSWIIIHANNTATFYVGKTDGGQGTGTAFRQMMSDELDIPFDKTDLIMGRTDITVDQGGSGGSTAIERDGKPMRLVAAEARRVLIELASARFGVPVSELTVRDGVIFVKADPSKSITYGELIGGRQFHVTLTGRDINATTGVAKIKAVQDLKVIGKPFHRYDIPPKVDGSLKWAVDAKAPGMVHARNVKPPVAGAKLMSIDESSVRGIPGFVKVVSKGNYVAVVCEREEQAIKASQDLKVEWQKPATKSFPGSEDLYKYMREATPTSVTRSRTGVPDVIGDPDRALASAAKVIEAEYEVPFQGHTAIGPAHAMADPSNGQMTI